MFISSILLVFLWGGGIVQIEISSEIAQKNIAIRAQQ